MEQCQSGSDPRPLIRAATHARGKADVKRLPSSGAAGRVLLFGQRAAYSQIGRPAFSNENFLTRSSQSDMAESIYFGFYNGFRIDIMNDGKDWWPDFEAFRGIKIKDDKIHRTFESAREKALTLAQQNLPGPQLDHIEWRTTQAPA